MKALKWMATLGLVIAGILLLVMPSPIPKLAHDAAIAAQVEAQAKAKQAKIARQKEIDREVATGEVGVSIVPVKRP